MKVSIKYENSDLKQYQDFVKKFINLLQDEYPLKDDIRIEFLNGRKGEMSTGSRRGDHLIKVLAKKRLNRDIMRTLAHEWVHEYQFAILNREHGPNIGGKNEDEANAVAGQIVKKFEKKYPKLEKLMYEGTGIGGKINLLTEQILIEEKTSAQNDLLLEMKKVGIEKLPYSYSSLGRFIDSRTMNIHYNKHYKGYVDKLNKALKDVDGDMGLEEIVKSISKFDNKVRNNAGGAFNHALFWKMLSPKKQKPKGNIFDKIKEDFGNIKKMKYKFNEAAKVRFGSGWAWLYLTKNGDLEIMSTPNQDNPLMNVVKKGGYPLLGLDVWEHAYYLKYQNKRDEYIEKFWDVVNWEFVEELYNQHTKKKNLKENYDNSNIISEAKKDPAFPYTAKQTRDLIYPQYVGCYEKQFKYGCLGKIEKKRCQTSLGVLGGDFAENKYGGNSNWSIINRFDTNKSVHREIIKIWKEETQGLEDIATWIKQHAYDLFSNEGMYTERLVDINSEIISDGNLNEDYAKQIIIEQYNLDPANEGITYELYESCSGDPNDIKKGQDIILKLLDKNEVVYFQVKPFKSDIVILYGGGDRGIYFIVPSSYNMNKYKAENVDVFVFVDREQQKFMMFRNDKNRILTIANPDRYPPFLNYFYELPLKSNFKVPESEEPIRTPIKKSLERDKDKEIQYYKDRIKVLMKKVEELGGSVDIENLLEYYQKELEKISF
jgi:Fe-Mn family superoxide dismutase